MSRTVQAEASLRAVDRARLLARTAALAATLAAASAFAQRPATDATPAPRAGSQKATVAKVARITAKIESLDRAARTVTLRGSKGAMTFAAGPEVRGFDQVRAGDLVVVRYFEPVLIEIRKGGAAARERIEPGAEGAPRRVTIAAEVVGKDAAKRTVTLRGAKQAVELRVAGGGELKAIQAGDRVEATYTEATAIAIELAVSRPNEARK